MDVEAIIRRRRERCGQCGKCLLIGLETNASCLALNFVIVATTDRRSDTTILFPPTTDRNNTSRIGLWNGLVKCRIVALLGGGRVTHTLHSRL